MNFLPNTLKHTLRKFEPFADQDLFDVAYIFVHILKLYFLFALFLIMLCNRYALLRLAFVVSVLLTPVNPEFSVRENLRASKKEFNKTEDDLKSLQSVGQIIGEVLRPLDNERCKFSF